MYNYSLFSFIILFVLSHVSSHHPKSPLIKVSCDTHALHVNVVFRDTFKGSLYVRGHANEPRCSWNSSTVGVLETSLDIGLSSCGTYLQKSPGNHPWVLNMIVIQHHPLLRTTRDFIENVACQFTEEQWETIQVTQSPLQVRSWLEFRLGSDALGPKKAESLGLSEELLLTFRIQDGGYHEYGFVHDCINHNDSELDPSTAVHQMLDFSKCSKEGNEAVLSFAVTRPSHSELLAFTDVTYLNINSRNSLFITCVAVLCKEICTCSDDKAMGIFIVATQKITRRFKRSVVDLNPPSGRHDLKKNESKTDLRTTVKTMIKRLVTYRNKSLERRNIEEKIYDKRGKVEDRNLNLEPTFKNSPNVSNKSSHEKFAAKAISSGGTNRILDNGDLGFEVFQTTQESNSTEEILVASDGNFYVLEEGKFSEISAQKKPTITILPEGEDIFMSISQTEKKNDSEVWALNVSDKTFYKNISSTAHDSWNCIPTFKFLIVTLVLAVIIVCLLILSCGIFLNMRKEKKNEIDALLLYNFY